MNKCQAFCSVLTQDQDLCENVKLCYVSNRDEFHSMAIYIPCTSLSFLNHRMSAAGLLPDVMHVSVTSSPSTAGLVKPVISGFSGTPGKIKLYYKLCIPSAWDIMPTRQQKPSSPEF